MEDHHKQLTNIKGIMLCNRPYDHVESNKYD